MPIKNPRKVAVQALATLHRDREGYLLEIDKYERGDQPMPFMPDNADAEYKLLAKRAVTNIMPFLIGIPAQMMYVDSFRRGRTSEGSTAPVEARVAAVQPEWDHWQRSRMDARQGPVYRGAFKFGHSFVVTEKDKDDQVISKGLSALNTTALYEDAANDADPYVAITVTRWNKGERVGLARMWDDTYEYPVTFKSLNDADSIRVGAGKRHGAKRNPVTRFSASVDLEGRTVGVVEPMMVLQDRINQTVFDLLIVQSFASFKVRTISGMAPPIKMDAYNEAGELLTNPEKNPEEIAEWRPRIDPNTGRPVPDEININAKRLFFAQDPETKFGTLDETPLNGFIEAIELAFRHMAALSQTPPHHILGEIANISAEALNAAETSLSRKVEEFKAAFGESWERVFRVAAEIGEYEGADDFSGEVIWRDSDQRSLAQAADALGKLADQLGIPKRGLWKRVPNVTTMELAEWEELYEEDNPDAALARKATPSSTSTRPSFRLAAGPEPAEDEAA